MKRFYTNGGQGISTKIKSAVDGKKYIISTAKDPRFGWQLAVFRIHWEIPHIYPGKVDVMSPLRFMMSQTFEEAEKIHLETEQLVVGKAQELWRNYPSP